MAANEELDLYHDDPMQLDILDRETQIVLPQTNNYDQTIEFNVLNSLMGKYVDPSNVFMEIEVGLQKVSDSTDLVLGTNVAPINNLLHSMFRNVQVQLNQIVINESNNTYPYIAYLETLLTYNDDYLGTQGKAFMWEKDDAGSMDETVVDLPMDEKTLVIKKDNFNPALAQDLEVTLSKQGNCLGHRQNKFFNNATGQAYHTVKLYGRPFGELFLQEKYLPYGANLYIQLDRAGSPFVLMNGENSEYKLMIKSARLFVDYVTINPKVFQAHLQRKVDVKIPILRSVVRTHVINKGTVTQTINTMFNGDMPKKLVLGMVTNTALKGKKNENPFNFQHFNIDHLQLYKNGKYYPHRPLNPDFDNKQYMRSYLTLYEGTGALHQNVSLPIEYNDYGQGFALWCFDFTGEGKSGQDDGVQHIKEVGNITIDIKFKKELPAAVSLVAYAEYENEIKIDQYNQVHKDY